MPNSRGFWGRFKRVPVAKLVEGARLAFIAHEFMHPVEYAGDQRLVWLEQWIEREVVTHYRKRVSSKLRAKILAALRHVDDAAA